MKRRINAFMALTMLSLSVSAPAFAVENRVMPPRGEVTAFCASLSTLQKLSESQIEKRLSNRTETFTNNATKREENRKGWDEKRAESQKNWDENREKNLANLGTKAKTPAQKAAVQAYRSALLAAVEARRLAYDKARSDFRAGVDKVLADRNANLVAQFTQYKADSAAAFAKAEIACKAPKPDGNAVRTALLADLKAAREKLNVARKANPKVGEQISALAQKRHEAEKVADEAFKKARESAREVLQKTLAEAKATLMQQKEAKSVKNQVRERHQVRSSAPAPVNAN